MIHIGERANQDLISEYTFFNELPIYEKNFTLDDKNYTDYIKSLPKNFTIYTEDEKKISCNNKVARAAFPHDFTENKVDSSKLVKSLPIKIFNEMCIKYPALKTIQDLTQEKEKLSFERDSFYNQSLANMFCYENKNADRSKKRKKKVERELARINKKIELMNDELSINAIYAIGVKKNNSYLVEKFLNGEIPLSHVPHGINSLFFERFFNNPGFSRYTIFINEVFERDDVRRIIHKLEVNSNAASIFSDRILKNEKSKKKITVDLVHATEAKVLLAELFDTSLFHIKNSDLDVWKEIAEVFDSKPLQQFLTYFDVNDSVLEQSKLECEKFIELQDILFEATEDNLEDVLDFIKNSIWCVEIEEISHQLKLCSLYRPNKTNVYKKLGKLIKNELPCFQYTIMEFEFTEIEKMFLYDDIDALQEFSSKIPFDIDQVVKCNYTYLSNYPPLVSIAAFFGAMKCFRFLCVNGADLDVPDKKDLYPFQFAVAGGNFEIVRYFFDHDMMRKARFVASLYHRNSIFVWLTDVCNDDSYYIISSAYSNNFFTSLHFLERKVYTDPKFDKALQKSLKLQHSSFFRFLMTFPCAEYSNLILPAIESNDIEILKLIFSFGQISFYSKSHEDYDEDSVNDYYNGFFNNFQNFNPNNNLINNTGSQQKLQVVSCEKMFLAAIHTKNPDIIDYIVKIREIENQLKQQLLNHVTIARAIIETKNRAIIQKFISYGNIFHGSVKIERFIQDLISDNDLETVKCIVDDSYFKARCDWSPLPDAQSVETAQYLIDSGSNINYRDINGYTCLHYAAMQDNLELIDFLLSNGASIDQSDIFSAAPNSRKILDSYLDSFGVELP
ncbi:hypothetical protein TRFO_08568 [Tritrichomonas foetus]|uniref:DUF3447 domain-containing protein n=1 Tax=Tritrichomonas foetus TaxID=1144522 RepID=A0A1J4JN97_9EUKA|nr:hypothetical protein TRFO_08568 [Tritrichomonas foetus]|eukprot:OHS99019.1 hypothetical protein TRFO_08568 [Tritrichomonas foetus]